MFITVARCAEIALIEAKQLHAKGNFAPYEFSAAATLGAAVLDKGGTDEDALKVILEYIEKYDAVDNPD